MSLTDPVSDFLTRVRNAIKARQQKVDVPHSKLKVEMARILKEEGYISNFKPTDEEGRKVLRVYLKYSSGQRLAHLGPEAGVASRLPRVRRTHRNSAHSWRAGNQHSDHAQGRDDRSPGAQRRRRRRSVCAKFTKSVSAIGGPSTAGAQMQRASAQDDSSF